MDRVVIDWFDSNEEPIELEIVGKFTAGTSGSYWNPGEPAGIDDMRVIQNGVDITCQFDNDDLDAMAAAAWKAYFK